MTDQGRKTKLTDNHSPVPVAIQLHRQRRVLELKFDDGSHFELPCEYLRVFSPAAEARVGRTRGDWVMGREDVNIDRITPVGTYAVQLVFDDGHDTGVYAWETLYELGRSYGSNRAEYQRERVKYARDAARARKLRIWYFATLAGSLGLESEDIELADGIGTVAELLAWLRERGSQWREGLNPERVTVTVNRQFAVPQTRLKPGDEVSVTPVSL